MFTQSQQGSVDVVAGEGALTRDTTEHIQRAMAQCLLHAPPRVVLDMQKLRVLDSTGLECLLDLQDAMEQRGGCLKLAGPGALCRDILAATGVCSRFEVYGNVKSAVGSFIQ